MVLYVRQGPTGGLQRASLVGGLATIIVIILIVLISYLVNLCIDVWIYDDVFSGLACLR